MLRGRNVGQELQRVTAAGAQVVAKPSASQVCSKCRGSSSVHIRLSSHDLDSVTEAIILGVAASGATAARLPASPYRQSSHQIARYLLLFGKQALLTVSKLNAAGSPFFVRDHTAPVSNYE